MNNSSNQLYMYMSKNTHKYDCMRKKTQVNGCMKYDWQFFGLTINKSVRTLQFILLYAFMYVC